MNRRNLFKTLAGAAAAVPLAVKAAPRRTADTTCWGDCSHLNVTVPPLRDGYWMTIRTSGGDTYHVPVWK